MEQADSKAMTSRPALSRPSKSRLLCGLAVVIGMGAESDIAVHLCIEAKTGLRRGLSTDFTTITA
jgi:hypothetical protein